jgi:hypothetical protein
VTMGTQNAAMAVHQRASWRQTMRVASRRPTVSALKIGTVASAHASAPQLTPAVATVCAQPLVSANAMLGDSGRRDAEYSTLLS